MSGDDASPPDLQIAQLKEERDHLLAHSRNLELELRRVGASAMALPLSPPKTVDGAIVREATATMTVTKDTAFVFVASGPLPMRPVLSGSDDAELRPWAMTAPIWVDADGDGRSLGR